MFILILGILVFIGIHLLPTFSARRNRLLEQWGEKKYKALFSLVSFIGLILIIVGKANAPFVHLWVPPVWGGLLALALMPFSFMLFAAANMPTNIKRLTPHPMLWGITLWAAVHLSANGDLASLILFGGIGAFALFDVVSANRRGATLSTEKVPWRKDAIIVGAGFLVYGVFLFLHPYLFGVPAFYLG